MSLSPVGPQPNLFDGFFVNNYNKIQWLKILAPIQEIYIVFPLNTEKLLNMIDNQCNIFFPETVSVHELRFHVVLP